VEGGTGRNRLIWAALAAACVLLVAACGGGHASQRHVRRPSSSLCVLVSLPLQGPKEAVAQQIATGVLLGLREAEGRAGGFHVSLCGGRVFNDANAGGWSAAQVAKRTGVATQNPEMIAYIGDLDSGASAVASALLTAAGIPQVALSPYLAPPTSPVTTPPTTRGTVEATAVHLVGTSHEQAAAAVAAMRDRGCRHLTVIGRRGDAGSLARDVRASATSGGLSLAKAAVGCVFDAETEAPAAPFTPGTTVFGNTLVCGPSWEQVVASSEPEPGVTRLCIAPAHSNPNALPEGYGVVAIKLVLAAIRSLGSDGDNRAAMVRALFAAKLPSSLIGPVSFDREGALQITGYGLYDLASTGVLGYLLGLPA
jgi:ABC-type branched-subunit amino acid transport system substrate-binding protein